MADLLYTRNNQTSSHAVELGGGIQYQNTFFLYTILTLCGIAIIAGCVIMLYFMDNEDNPTDPELAHTTHPLSSPPSLRRNKTMQMRSIQSGESYFTTTNNTNYNTTNHNQKQRPPFKTTSRSVENYFVNNKVRSVESYMRDERSRVLMLAKRVWEGELAIGEEGKWVERGRGRVRRERGELVHERSALLGGVKGCEMR